LLYVAGLVCCGRFYEQVLRASPTPIGLLPAVRAYLISHLGKYVPGKAMVVVMRAGLSVPAGARAASAAIATFYETLVMMTSGSLIAALGFAMVDGSPSRMVGLPLLGETRVALFPAASLFSLSLGVAFLVVVTPRVFGRLAGTISLPFPSVGAESVPAFSAGLLSRGLAWTTLAWVLLGISQLAAAAGLSPVGVDRLLPLSSLVTASVALATVAGFVVAVLPGGLGVREGVLMLAMAPALGEDLAVVAALALRLIWVAAELLAAALLLPFRPGARPPGLDTPETGPTP
jgi:hypothetical protein